MTEVERLDVVHVITSLPTGGAERQLELVLARTRHRATTICLYEGGPVADDLRSHGHDVQVLGMAGIRRWTAVPRLAAELRRRRPDVVHVHLLAAQLWGIPAARLARVPVVVSSEHSLMEDSIEGRPHRWWLRLLYRALERASTATVAVSATTAERLAAWGVSPARVTTVDNGIDFAALAPDPAARAELRREWGVADGARLVVVVGRLDPVKRVDEVLTACAPRLRAGGHHLVVMGSGPLRPELEALAERLGIGGAVRFLGARSDVARVLSAADVMVSASRDETFGMAVVEAVASGLPVVYVQCPALEELAAPPASAVRVEPERLAAGLDAVLSRPPVRAGVPPELVARYGADAAAAALDDLYPVLRSRRPTSRGRRWSRAARDRGSER